MKTATIRALLPEIMRRADAEGTPLRALLMVMSDHLTPVGRTLAELDAVFSPVRTSDAFVAMLADWTDLARYVVEVEAPDGQLLGTITSAHGRLRTLVAASGELARLRGTREGLRLFLELATGVRGFAIDEPREQPFQIIVTAPAEARPHRVLVEAILAGERPACTQCALRFAVDPDESSDPTPPPVEP